MMPPDVTIVLAIANFVILVAALCGGYIALRSSISKTSAMVQDRVREALKDENELLQSRVVRVEAENRRLSERLQLLIAIFEKRGITIIIDDGMIQVKDKDGSTITVRASPPDGGATSTPVP